MNKVIAVIVGVLIIGSGAFVFLNRGDEQADLSKNNVNSSASMVGVEKLTEKEQASELGNNPSETNNSEAGKYIEFSDSVLADSSDTKRVLFFHAPWCSTCNFFEGQIEEQGVPSGVTIIKVDYDSETEIKKQYGVTVQSTFVSLDQNGGVEQTWPFASGLKGIQDLYDIVI